MAEQKEERGTSIIDNHKHGLAVHWKIASNLSKLSFLLVLSAP
jgi:hypothetical protein